MGEQIITGIATVLLLGLLAQLVAWRFRFPSILLLLLVGFTAGPVTGLLDPNTLFGELLFPIVSISVAIILFEGGLSLQFAELGHVGSIVLKLITIGVIITAVVGTAAAYYLLGLDLQLSLLLGSILTVSGPTVVLPLLRHIRPRAPLSEILKWEGILIDPVGALLAVMVFEAIVTGDFSRTPSHIFFGIMQALIIGVGAGGIAAFFLGMLLRHHLIPDFLQNPFTLAVVVGTYVLSNHLYPESGLLSVTLMAIILANMKNVTVVHLLEFKEDLRVLIISSLFIILSARITFEQLAELHFWGSLGLLAVLFFIARPLSVLASVVGTKINFKEAAFLSWVAPRGIVAAAVSSLFSLELVASGYQEAELLVPYVFLVIVGTVTIYGLTASPLANFLNLSQASPQGVLFLGSNEVTLPLAAKLHENGVPVLLADTNYDNISNARVAGLPHYFGNIVSGEVLNQLPLDGIGKLFAMTQNDDANSLAALHCAEIFERANIYQLAPSAEKMERNKKDYPMHLRGRSLFQKDATYERLFKRLEGGAQIKITPITDEYGYDEYQRDHNGKSIPLLILTEDRQVKVFTDNTKLIPKKNEKLVAIF